MNREKIHVGSVIELQDRWAVNRKMVRRKIVNKKIVEVGVHLLTAVRYQKSLKIKGVKITNKWCEKFGYSSLKDLVKDLNSKIKYNTEYQLKDIKDIKDLKIHKVQDLFFAMTGEMLKLKHDL